MDAKESAREARALLSLARRDVLRFWAEQVALAASTLRSYRKGVAVFLLTSPPSAELWIRRALPAHAGIVGRDGGSTPIVATSTTLTAWTAVNSSSDGTEPSGRAESVAEPHRSRGHVQKAYTMSPLDDCAAISQAMEPHAGVEFNHDLYAAVNDMSAAAFRAAVSSRNIRLGSFV